MFGKLAASCAEQQSHGERCYHEDYRNPFHDFTLFLGTDEYIPKRNDESQPTEVRCPGGLKQYVTAFRTAFPYLHITFEDQVVEGDKVATRITLRGTHTCELEGIPAKGRKVTITSIRIDRLETGKFMETLISSDILGLLQQLGVIPPPGQAER